jgi:hypothetical protein
MTLSGVLKDILLVAASMLIFRDPVSGLQAFGYTIALCGLVYYKLGVDNIKDYISHGQRSWADFGARKPILRRLVVIALVVGTVFLLLGGVSFSGWVSDKHNPAVIAQQEFRKVMDKTGAFGGA